MSVSDLAERVSQPEFIIHQPSIHTAGFDSALSNFQTTISPLKNPKEWLDGNRAQLNSILPIVINRTNSIEIKQAFLDKTMIYQRLILSNYLHLMFCMKDNSILNELKQNLTTWRSWSRVTILENYQAIREYLLNISRRLCQEDSILHSDNQLKRLLAIGDVEVCAYLAVIVTENATYRELLSRRGTAAQAILNLLHARLGLEIDEEYKSRHVKTLIRLSRASSLYPKSLILEGVEIYGEVVASGGFGDVYRGRIRNQEIAVKLLRVYQKSDIAKLLKGFASEAVTWGQLNHPNLLPFYGICRVNNNAAIVCLASPWMDYGSVVHFLGDVAPDMNCILLSLDVALGLEYLHKEKIIHGDLKALNILVSRSKRARIADFGLSTAIESQRITCMSTNKSTGTLRWQAPELLPDMDDSEGSMPGPTSQTDVYAFALVCYEMFSGEYPFFNIAKDFQVMFRIKMGKRPDRPSDDLSAKRGLNDEMWQLITNCWAAEPTERPSATDIVWQLRTMSRLLVDERPHDDFGTPLVTQTLQDSIDRPLSCLEVFTPLSVAGPDEFLAVTLPKIDAITPLPPPEGTHKHNPVCGIPRPRSMMEYLRNYHVKFIIDNSPLTSDVEWLHIRDILCPIADVALKYNINTIDIYLQAPQVFEAVQGIPEVAQIFGRIKAQGKALKWINGCFNKILTEAIDRLDAVAGTDAYIQMKPVHIIALVRYIDYDIIPVLEKAHARLLKGHHHPNLISVQIIQAHYYLSVTRTLKSLSKSHVSMVDAVPLDGGILTSEKFQHIILGDVQPNVRALSA